MSETVYLIDGSGYIFRAFYGTPRLTTSSGFPTNALYGFARMLLALLKDRKAKYASVVFDTGEETFRDELYEDYKANREECPDELEVQMPYFREIAEALGFSIAEQHGYEADDVIGTLAVKLADSGLEVVIVTGDKDFSQLVNERITLWDPMRNKHVGVKEVREKFGVDPEYVADVLALMGDKSDNIPGIQGVGEKTAMKIVQQCGHVENILENPQILDKLEGIRGKDRIVSNIKNNLDILKLSKELSTIDTSVDFSFGAEGSQNGEGKPISQMSLEEILQELRVKELDKEALIELSHKFEFHSLFGELISGSMSEAQGFRAEAEIVTDIEQLTRFTELCKTSKEMVIDIETTGLDPRESQIVGFAIRVKDKNYYLPLSFDSGLSREILERLRELLSDETIKKIGHHLKFDLSVCLVNGISMSGLWFDTMIAGYLIAPDGRSYSLSTLAGEWLGLKLLDYKSLVGDKGDLSNVEVKDVAGYACADVEATCRLWKKLDKELERKDLKRVFKELEMPLIEILAHMELNGVKIDVSFLKELSDEFGERLRYLEARIYKLAGEEFNLNSPKQLSYILFEKLAISTKGLRKTKTGAISTNQRTLEALKGAHPIIDLLLEYRGLFKLKSTYVDVLPTLVSSKTGRLHSKFNQTATATGRLSSSDPNLQNIPIRGKEGSRIRRAFIAESGYKLISADYSQVELRILAHLSEDPVLIQSFMRGEDIHARTAREVLGKLEYEPISEEERRLGKTINFGIMYGMGPYRLARELGIQLHTAKSYIDGYFKKFKKVREYFDRIVEDGVKKGYVETLFGRKRFLEEIDASGRDQEFVKRAAINAPIQGTAADLIKCAMIKLGEVLSDDVKMILQIHDELVFEVKDNLVDDMSTYIKETMESVVKLKVPLKVDVGVGSNWDEAHT